MGDANFTNMEILDSDDVVLKDTLGNKAERDIVQFVPFNEFKSNPVRLREETLKELPDQITQFYAKRGILPQKGKISLFRSF